MKRFATLFALFAVLVPLTAHAGHWVQQTVSWRISNQGGPNGATAIWVRDSLYAPVPLKVGGNPDTTAGFNLNNASVWRRHDGAATTVDSVYFAYVVLQQDSTTSTTNTLSSLSYEIDGRAGGIGSPADLANWVQIDSTSVSLIPSSVYNRVVALPIRALSGLGGLGSNGPENALAWGYRINAFDTLRMRITALTGVFTGGIRAFIRYWDEDPQ